MNPTCKYFFNILLSVLTVIIVISCKQTPTINWYKINGQTMGTTYHITYMGSSNYKRSIDSMLVAINQQVSTYIDTSAISRFNQSNERFDLAQFLDQYADTASHFIQNYLIAYDIYTMTNRQFDPTVMPLVNYWGFGYQKREANIDSTLLDSLRMLVGMNQIKYESPFVFYKDRPQIQLDFSAVAKGYAVDEIADFLTQYNSLNYMVEIGGELRVKGVNNTNRPWVIGINQPSEKSTTNDLSLLISITDCAVATSGNYRNYYLANDQKFVHTINPLTGLTEQNNLLSATIVGVSCARVDAIATACMVMGIDDAITMITQNDALEACFIYSLPTGRDSVWVTDGFNEMIISNK